MRASALLTPLIPLLALVAPAFARSSTGDRVLVVLDDKYDRTTYSRFFASLEDRGFELTFSAPTAPTTFLDSFDEALYDHLILFAPEATKFNKEFTPQAILRHQASHLNTLHILSSSLTEQQRDTLAQYDIQAPPAGFQLVDAFSHVAGGNDDEVVLAQDQLVGPAPLLSDATRSAAGPVVFPSGTGFATGENPFLIDVLRAPAGSYVADKTGAPATPAKNGQEIALAGERVTVVAAMQNRENVRVGFVGSPEMLADSWWGKKLDGKETGNRAVIEDLTKWLFQETGVVRVVKTHHHREGETEPREVYRKKDEVSYSITLAQHETSANGTSSWKPFAADDLQLEFTMLDPHIRTALVKTSTTGSDATYSTSFRAPDRHGVFKFVVSYWRPGWSYLNTADKASVVPLRHDEHPRFIVGAYPFYAGAITTSAAFMLFCFLWASIGEGTVAAAKGDFKAE